MIGLDTNVLVRFLVQDDHDQSPRASAFVRAKCTADEPGWINRIVLVELAWVLRAAYRYPRGTIADVVEKLLRAEEFAVEDAEAAWTALRAYRATAADFADCLLAATNAVAGCGTTTTFDRDAARVDGFQPI